MIFQSNRGLCNAAPASGVVVAEMIPQLNETHTIRLLYPILAVIGCTNLDHLKDHHGVVIGRVDTGAHASSTDDTGGATAECEGLPDGFESTLVRGATCGDLYLERHNEDWTMQVTFWTGGLLAEARAANGPQVTVIDLADEEGRVRLHFGEYLGADACCCDDIIEVVDHSYAAIAGTAEIEVSGFYEVEGDPDDDGYEEWHAFATVRLSGVVLSDADSCELTLDDMEFSGWGGTMLPIG